MILLWMLVLEKIFLTDNLTLKYLRSDEHKLNIVANRKPHELWRKDGSPDIVDNAERKAEEIIKNYHPETLDSDINKDIKAIIGKFEQKYKN